MASQGISPQLHEYQSPSDPSCLGEGQGGGGGMRMRMKVRGGLRERLCRERLCTVRVGFRYDRWCVNLLLKYYLKNLNLILNLNLNLNLK